MVFYFAVYVHLFLVVSTDRGELKMKIFILQGSLVSISAFLFMMHLCVRADAAERMSWRKLHTAEDFVRNCPDHLKRLFNSLDPEREDMKEIAAAYKRGDKIEACKALLEFYRNGNQSSWYRKLETRAGKAGIKRADEILADKYTGMGQTGSVPRTREGHLKWAHRGPKNDWQFSLIALNRHGHLMALYRAWKETGKREYLERLDQDLRDWLIAAHGKAAPFKTSHLEPANRMRRWARLFFALQQEDTFRPATRLLMLASIPVHGNYLLKNTGKYNWVTMTQLGALLAGVCWPQFKQAGQWRKQSIDKLMKNARNSVYPDGVQKELTSSYHMVSLGRYQFAADLLEQAGMNSPETFVATLRKMWAYTAQIIRPTGTLPLNNDSDLVDHRPALLKMADQYNETEWLYAASNGVKGKKPADPPSRVLPWARQLISRDGWGTTAQWSFFDFGPAGVSHYHADHGHLSVQVGGYDILVDTGRFAYQGELAKAFLKPYVRHTRGHNSVLIDGKGQRCTPLRSENAAKVGHDFLIDPSFDYARAVWKNYEHLKGKATHYRSLVYVRGRFWVIVDRVKTDRPRTIETLWHFHPDCRTTVRDKAVDAVHPDGPGLRISPINMSGWSVKMIKGRRKPHPQGWYSKKYNSAEPAPCARYKTRIEKTATFGWIIHPSADTREITSALINNRNQAVAVVRLQFADGEEMTISIPVGKGKPSVRKIGSDTTKRDIQREPKK